MKSGALRELETWHTTMTAAGVQPHVLATDLGGEFVGQAADDPFSRLGITHRLRAPGAHAGDTESAHRHPYESARPALRDGSAPPFLWEDACLWAADAQNCRNAGGDVARASSCADQKGGGEMFSQLLLLGALERGEGEPACPYPRMSTVAGDRNATDGVDEASELELRLGAVAYRVEGVDLAGELDGTGV